MAENPFDRTNPTMRDCWDAGHAAGVAAERGVAAWLVALVQQMLDADAIAEWFMDTDNDGVDVRAALAAIRAGEVRG